MEFKQRPLGDMIVVQPIDPKPSRILLPDWQRTLRGKVLAVGPGAPLANGKTAPTQCKVGDYIVFAATAGMESSYAGISIRIMRDSDADGIIEDAA